MVARNVERRLKCKCANLAILTCTLPKWAMEPGPSAAPAGSSPGDHRTTTSPSPPFTVRSNSASTGSTRPPCTVWDTPRKWSAVLLRSGAASDLNVFTKCGLRGSANGEVQKVLNADSIRGEVEDSLRRLSVDVIDLYQIHWPPDPDSAALEEGWSTLADLKREGKLPWIGVSNFNVQQLRRAQAIAPVTSLQPRYSLVHSEIEDEILPFCLS